MITDDKHFADEEAVRRAREENGREHDCSEAGCTVGPDGLPVTGLNKAKRKDLEKDILDKIQELKDAGVID